MDRRGDRDLWTVLPLTNQQISRFRDRDFATRRFSIKDVYAKKLLYTVGPSRPKCELYAHDAYFDCELFRLETSQEIW